MKPLLLFSLLGLAACVQDRNQSSGQTQGYAPVYLSQASSKTVALQSGQPTVNAGKIYAYGTYLFQVEVGKGIHVINNQQPQAAVKAGFISVPGCSEIAIKSNYLYTNNINDLVVISLANPAAPTVVDRREGAFPQIDQLYPPVNGVAFECVDKNKGVVVGWEFKTLVNPKCRR